MAIAMTALADMIQPGGIGIAIEVRTHHNEPLRVARVYPGSPAESAGIKTNWFLISIAGTNVVSMSSQECFKLICGPVGTFVTLELAHPTLSRTNRFTVKRADVKMPDDFIGTNRPSGPLIAR
jgi:carboxyl-terminal processing protease